MAGTGAEPPARDERTGDEGRPHEEERTGPLAIARHVKDDGRALILYTRDPSAHADEARTRT